MKPGMAERTPSECRTIKEVAEATANKDNVKRACGSNSGCTPYRTGELDNDITLIAASAAGLPTRSYADLSAKKNKNNLRINCTGMSWRKTSNIDKNKPFYCNESENLPVGNAPLNYYR